MSIKVTPKVKIVTGIALVGGGVFELVNASKTKGGVRVVHVLAAGALMISGVMVARNGWKENSAQNLNPATKENNDKEANSLKKILQDVTTELKKPIEKKNNSVTRSQEAAQSEAEETESANITGVSKVSPKVIGKISPEKIEQTKKKQQSLKNRIDQLSTKLRATKTNNFDGHQRALGLKNEIALLTAQHRLAGSGSDFN